ncbi:hypothetical protein ABPG72_018545 [Tetrahymena utriculariae]
MIQLKKIILKIDIEELTRNKFYQPYYNLVSLKIQQEYTTNYLNDNRISSYQIYLFKYQRYSCSKLYNINIQYQIKNKQETKSENMLMNKYSIFSCMQAYSFGLILLFLIQKNFAQTLCYQVSSDKSLKQIQQIPLNQRLEYYNKVPNYNFALDFRLDNQDFLSNYPPSLFCTYLFVTTSNRYVLQMFITYPSIQQIQQNYGNQAFYMILVFDQLSFQEAINSQQIQTYCPINFYSMLTLPSFVQINSQSQQLMISNVLTSQINDLSTLVLLYPTSFASQPQNSNNLGCQLYTDFGSINECSFATNSSSSLSSVSFNLTNLNFSLQNISTTILLNSSTFIQNKLSSIQFQMRILNFYQSQIAQSPLFAIQDQRKCQSSTSFSANLVDSTMQIQQLKKLQVSFTPVSQNITRIMIDFLQQVNVKINSTNIVVILSDISQTNSIGIFCNKVYQSLVLCDLTNNMLFDITKGILITLPFFQTVLQMQQSTFPFKIVYYTDLSYSNCYVTTLTIKYLPIPSSSSSAAYLYSNNTLQVSILDKLSLDSSMSIKIQLPSSIAFSQTSQLGSTSGISSLSQISVQSLQSVQLSQLTQSIQSIKSSISFSFTNINQINSVCNFNSTYLVMIQIMNSQGLLIFNTTPILQIQSKPISILSINTIYLTPDSQQQSQQQNNYMNISMNILEINFQLQASYYPQQSAFMIYLPPQLQRDSRINNMTADLSNEFLQYCKSQINSSQLSNQTVNYQNIIQQRETISIICQYNGKTNTQNTFTVRIQGYLLPRQLQKPTDRLIIDLVDFSQKQNQPLPECLTTENPDIPNQVKGSWVFTNTKQTNFFVSQYNFQFSGSSDQSTLALQSLLNITTYYNIQDDDLLLISFSKISFVKVETLNGNYLQNQNPSQYKNLNCSLVFPQSSMSSSALSQCTLSEGASSYQIKIVLKTPNLNSTGTWNNKDIFITINSLAFQQSISSYNTSIQFMHFSSDNYILSQSNSVFSSQLTTSNAFYSINQIGSLSQQNITSFDYQFKFDFITIQFLTQTLISSSDFGVNLALSFSQQVYFSDQTFCSLDSICSQSSQEIKCKISADGLTILLSQIDQNAFCLPSILTNFNITIHNPEINNSNSTGGAQSIAINWNLTSTTTSQTLLSGHTSLTTNTSQCPQPHCATCTSLPYMCLHCTQGYYLLPDQDSCVQTCPPPTVAHQQTATCQPCVQHQECLQCQSQDPAACTSCSPNYSLNSTLLPYCYVPLPPSSSGSSSVTKDVVNRTPSNSTFSGELNRLEPGQHSQKQQAQASDERGFAYFLAQTKSYTKGFVLTLLIPLSILGACLTRLVTFCLKKREKKVHGLPSESRSAQIAQNLDERQETQKDGNGGDEEQMRASSRVDTGNMCPLNSRRGEQLQLGSVEQQSDGGGQSEGNGQLAFCWIAVILLLGNLGELVEVPYIIFSQQNSFSNKSTNVVALQVSAADLGQICCLSYIALNGVCYLICVVMMVKAIIFESGSGEPLFSIYEVRLSSSSSFSGGEEMKKDKSEVECKEDSNIQKEKKEKHKKVMSGRKLWKLIIDVLLRCLVAVGGKAFCMVYSNVANVKGWLTCQVNKNLRAFRLFYRILCIHTMFNMVSAAFFTFMLTHLSFASWTSVGEDSLTSQGSDGRVEFSFFVDILAFKFLMSLICFLNCMHIQQLIAACKSSNLPGHQHQASHPVQSPSTPSSSPSPAGAVGRGIGKASYFESTPNAESTTPTAAVTLTSYRQQDASGIGSQNLKEGRPRRKKPSKLSLLLKSDSGQKPGSSFSSRQQETPSPNLPSYSPNMQPSQAYI